VTQNVLPFRHLLSARANCKDVSDTVHMLAGPSKTLAIASNSNDEDLTNVDIVYTCENGDLQEKSVENYLPLDR
jgi:hypothetical protein